MAINWTTFTDKLTSFFVNYESASLDETANKITDEYFNAVSSATTIFGNPLINTNKQLLFNRIKQCFELQFNSPTHLGLPPYTIMANGFVEFWSTALFNPLPPNAPTTSPTTGVQILVPGLPTPLDANLLLTFNSQIKSVDINVSAFFIVSNLITSLTAFHTTISGIYNGLIPGLPPVPTAVPWVGII